MSTHSVNTPIPAVPVLPTESRLRPVSMTDVNLTGGLWGTLQDTNATASLEHCLTWMNRLGWIENFHHVAAGTTSGRERPGWVFADSEIYKVIEALCWEGARTRSRWVEERIRSLTAIIAEAQDDDGYLNTAFGHAGQADRWSDLAEGHELYNLGHLLQAGVARLRTHGDDELVSVVRRAADLVCEVFGPDGRDAICGHPEIEVGLAELARATGEPRYLDQAALFLDRRGHGLLGEGFYGAAYFQDDVPIRKATAWRGHAVRALYLSAAAVDVAVDTGDDDLLLAIETQWTHSVARRTHVTGGMGSRHQDEGFGEDWELTPDRAYCETCAGIASIMVSWRLLLQTGESRYADLIERTLHNIVATSPRSDGRAFFYANTLQQRAAGDPNDDDTVSGRAESSSRAAWFDVSCCPSNLARTLASLGSYVATTDDHGVQVHLFTPATIRTEIASAGAVVLDVGTRYPSDGEVAIEVREAGDGPWTLSLRVPAWAEGAELVDPDGSTTTVNPGIARLTRSFAAGDRVCLRLPVRPRVTYPDPRIDSLRGCVAVERGPDVLCLQESDLNGLDLDDLAICSQSVPRDTADGLVEIDGLVESSVMSPGWPYGSLAVPGNKGPVRLVLRPYRTWAQEAPTRMRVWTPIG